MPESGKADMNISSWNFPLGGAGTNPPALSEPADTLFFDAEHCAHGMRPSICCDVGSADTFLSCKTGRALQG